VTSGPATPLIWRSRRRWKKQLLVTRLTWCCIVSSASRQTPRSRSNSTGVMTSPPTDRVRFFADILRILTALPYHTSSVFCAFNCSLREAHHARTSRIQLTRRSRVGDYSSRRVELLIVSMNFNVWLKLSHGCNLNRLHLWLFSILSTQELVTAPFLLLLLECGTAFHS